jgi:hypothetical protein
MVTISGKLCLDSD